MENTPYNYETCHGNNLIPADLLYKELCVSTRLRGSEMNQAGPCGLLVQCDNHAELVLYTESWKRPICSCDGDSMRDLGLGVSSTWSCGKYLFRG
jgi:hypothetical protein